MTRLSPACASSMVLVLAAACGDDGAATPADTSTGPSGATSSGTTAPTSSGTETGGGTEIDPNALANGCYALRRGDDWMIRTASDDGYALAPSDGEGAARFFLKASDLGTYLLYDEGGGYLVAEDGPLLRQTELASDLTLVDDTYVSGAEWMIEPAAGSPGEAQLHHRRTDRWLGADGLVDEAAATAFVLEPATECLAHPELTLDATGAVTKTTFDDGALYGIVDTHSHILSNFAFGGGGIFHGAPFHRLGVTHALSDCAQFHGEMGRKDFFGYAFDTAGADGADFAAVLQDLLVGELAVDNHATAGYPEFTEWPNAPSRSTHQTQYYRWLERAYLGGLRLVVQHATTNSVICNMTAGQGIQEVRYACDDMVAVDRILEETYAMERYIDAQAGGPGLGFFRIVLSPVEAREVIAAGKMAVVLGIETSDLFDCRLVPHEGGPVCDDAYVAAQLDAYYGMGVRAIFPVHKYDNAFSPGDGDRSFIELGNFFNSGHWSNFTEDCPEGVPHNFDGGDVVFGGINMPRPVYDAPPPNDFSNFPDAPLATAFPYISAIGEPPLVGDYCQAASMTDMGETMLAGMMSRGMIIEVDHLPRRAYARAFELLEAADYPAAGTHGGTYDGRIYALGGVSKTGLGRCRDPQNPGSMLERLQERIALIEANGGYPAEGFGFDLNGFAGAPGPRFADGACPTEQDDPVTYPFTSIAGDVEFTEPVIGERTLDFNTEGLVHIGLLPELIEDARKDAVSEADLEPLFRSAEGYIRMWERAEERAGEL